MTTDRETLHGFIQANVDEGSIVNTDDFKAYKELRKYYHHFVRHSAGEYVNEMALINGIESFRVMLKRGHKGTCHKFSRKRLHRYIAEFEGRHDIRELGTIDQMEAWFPGRSGKGRNARNRCPKSTAG